MILDNLSRAIRTQNWLAAGIEFVIVIAGVVIGFQINAWNEARQRLAAESEFLQRLHTEIVEALDGFDDERFGTDDRYNRLLEAVELIFDPESDDDLTAEQCLAVGASHLYADLSVPLPALDELIASGRLGLIQNPQIRSGLAAYLQTKERIRNNLDLSRQNAVALSESFPYLMPLRAEHRTNIAQVGLRQSCDVNGMRSDQQFLNSFALNADMYDNHHRNGVLAERDALRVLEDTLASGLSD